MMRLESMISAVAMAGPGATFTSTPGSTVGSTEE
jgi:hypothetical protein